MGAFLQTIQFLFSPPPQGPFSRTFFAADAVKVLKHKQRVGWGVVYGGWIKEGKGYFFNRLHHSLGDNSYSWPVSQTGLVIEVTAGEVRQGLNQLWFTNPKANIQLWVTVHYFMPHLHRQRTVFIWTQATKLLKSTRFTHEMPCGITNKSGKIYPERIIYPTSSLTICFLVVCDFCRLRTQGCQFR